MSDDYNTTNLYFDVELNEILDPEEIIFLSLIIEGKSSFHNFFDSSVYHKLFDFFSEEMPYGVAKCREGDPDIWILDRIMEYAK